MVEFEQRQLDQERAIERESGVENLVRRREIGNTLVLFKQQYQTALTDYRRLWRRSFSRARDCVERPSLRGVVKLGGNAKDKVRDGTAIEVSLHVPYMGDAGSKRLVWRGDAVAFEFEKVAIMGGKIVGGDVEVRVRCLGGSCGDISGAVTVKVPADHVEVVLNAVPKSEAKPVDP